MCLCLCVCVCACVCVRACVCGTCVCPGDLSHQGSSVKDDVSVLQTALAALDREKDALQDTVDQKTETMALLQEDLHSKVWAQGGAHMQSVSALYYTLSPFG